MGEDMSENTTTEGAAGAAEPDVSVVQTIAQTWGAVKRRRWWLLTSSCCIPIAVVVVALKLPNKYVSQATLLLVQQQVSQRYVEPDSTAAPADAVEGLKLEVLSDSRLVQIINDMGLYPTQRPSEPPELLVDRMRKDIDVEPLGTTDFKAFTIAFTAGTPQLAEQVTDRLTSLFIEENLKARGEQATNTTKFLSDQLEAAKQRLAEQEQRLQAFESQNAGELPEQQQTNMLALTGLRTTLDAMSARMSQLQQEQTFIQTTLIDRLARLQSERADLLKNFTPRHPEVVKKDREIATIQTVLDRVKSGTITGDAQVAISSDDLALTESIRQAAANRAEIDSLSKQEQSARTEVQQYQTRLNLAPVREQQLQQILRDREAYSKDYDDLRKNQMQSQLTTTLEENQEGQHFRLVDPPTLPAKPSGPKRLKICLAGVAGGIALGLVLVFLTEMRSNAFYSERILAKAFAVPLVVGIPFVPTLSERRARGWRLLGECILAFVMIVALCASEFYVFRNG